MQLLDTLYIHEKIDYGSAAGTFCLRLVMVKGQILEVSWENFGYASLMF